MSFHAHRAATVEEDASKLELGPDFQETACLSVSEVKALLEQRESNEKVADTPVYSKTMNYVNQFSAFGDFATIQSVRTALQKMPELAPFEQAQLSNLCPHDVEEARALIPSLQDKDEETLQALLNEMQSLRRYQ